MKKAVILAICLIFTEAAISFAQTAQKVATGPLRKSGGELGFEVSSIKYEEPDMNEEGIMYGVSGSYANHSNKIMLGFDGRFTFGQVDYNGQLSDGTPYTVDNIDDYIMETRLSIGYDYAVSETTFITPYIGIGYRYLMDAMSCSQYGYDRESNYLYSPIGIDAIANLGNGWSIGLIAEYDLFWYGLQRTHFEDVIPGADVCDCDQKSGYGARGSIRIEKKTKAIDFVIEPFVRYWDIKQSETSPVSFAGTYIIGWAYEPANTSTEWGVKLALRF